MDSIEISEVSLSSAKVLIKESGCDMPVFRQDYVHLFQQLAGMVEGEHQKSIVYRRNVRNRVGKFDELTLTIRLLAGASLRTWSDCKHG